MSGAPAVPPDLCAALDGEARRLGVFGARVVHFPSVGSTNDVAARLANEGAAEGTLVVADAQTAGRGRAGHTWYSPPGAGLYASIVLRPPGGSVLAAPDSAGLITLMTGVAVADTLGAVSRLEAAIKWPNDVVIPGGGGGWRKIAGILAEGSMASGTLLHMVLGVGINLARAAYPPELVGLATSIEEESGRTVERSRVLVELLAALAREYAALAAGDVRGVLARWRARSPLSSGAPIAWTTAAGHREGVTAGIDDMGALLARTSDGTEVIRAGIVRWL